MMMFDDQMFILFMQAVVKFNALRFQLKNVQKTASGRKMNENQMKFGV